MSSLYEIVAGGIAVLNDEHMKSFTTPMILASLGAPGTFAPPLPYTAPPPAGSRPRYSGTGYPDLAVSGARPQPAQQHQPYVPTLAYEHGNQPHGRYIYGAEYPQTVHTHQHPHSRERGRAAPSPPQYPPGYGTVPMPFFADASTPGGHAYEWPVAEDSTSR